MVTNSKLTLECLAIGSLPHINLENAMELVKKDFKNIPFWPQLKRRHDFSIFGKYAFVFY